MGRSKGRVRGRLLAVGIVLGLLGVLELGLRAKGLRYDPLEIPIIIWTPEHDARLEESGDLHRFDPRTLWLPREDAAIPWADDRVTAGGFRREDPLPDARVRVLVLGDSSTFGFGVAADETYASVLERCLLGRLGRELEGQGNARELQVLNGGVVGSTILQGLGRYRMIRQRWHPDVVVLAFGAVNEHWPSIDLPDRAKLELAGSGERSATRLRRWLRRELRVVHLVAYLRDRSRGGRRAILLEMAEEGRPGLLEKQSYLENPGYERRVSPAEFAEGLERFLAEIRSDGAALALLHMPRRPSVEERLPPVLDYDPLLAAFAARRAVPLADGRGDFRAALAAGLAEDDLFLDPYHPNERGHGRLGRLLCGTIEPLVRAVRSDDG